MCTREKKFSPQNFTHNNVIAKKDIASANPNTEQMMVVGAEMNLTCALIYHRRKKLSLLDSSAVTSILCLRQYLHLRFQFVNFQLLLEQGELQIF